MPTALSVRDLRKSFGDVVALAGITLEVRSGEVFGLLGPNGAGKTTTVRAIAGRVRPDSGTIEIAGVLAPPGDAEARGVLGWVPQEIALYPLLTVGENLDVFARFNAIDAARIPEAIARALEWAGLSEHRDQVTAKLSGGMKRRLNMAAGVIHEPKVVLMDEPTVGVDLQSREKIYAMIEEMKQQGATVVYTSHYMEEVERLCDRIAVIDHGRVIAIGNRDELVETTVGRRREALVELTDDPSPSLAAWLAARDATVDGRRVVLPIVKPASEIAELLARLEMERAGVADIALTAPTLGEVFLRLTGRELRD